jgi:glycosyltransferase involved in cell wall biosynthesis
MDECLGAPLLSFDWEEGGGLGALYFSSAAHVQGGAAQCMFKNARWLQRCGGKPLVVLPDKGRILDWYEREEIEVLVIPFVQPHRRSSVVYMLRYVLSSIGIALALAALIRQREIGVVHVNEIIYWPGLVAARIAGAKAVCHVRTIIRQPEWMRRTLTEMAYRLSDQVLCVSCAVSEKMFGSRGGKIRTLYDPGPDLDLFDPGTAGNRGEVRQEMGIEQDAFVIGLVSKFTRTKGHLALVEAARRIAEEATGMEVNYLMVGGRVVGHEAYHQAVRDRVSEYGLDSQFVFAGVRADVPRLMNACDVMVHLPQHDDPFPGVVLEAMAMERPVVATKSGGVPEQFEDGHSGLLVPKGDIQALVTVLLGLAKNPLERRRMGKAARAYLTSHFSSERFFLELRGVYEGLVWGSDPGAGAT